MNKQQIKKYLDTININYPIKELEDVSLLIKNHLKSLAFCSIPVVLKQEISLEIDNIFKKVVLEKKGAYCFEHNKLVYEVLKYFGFDVEHHFARIVNNQEIITPLTHRFTLLNFNNEKYIIDVGVGFISPATLIRFSDEKTYSHIDRFYKIITNHDKTYSLQMIQNNEAYTMYKFDLHKCEEIDFKLGNFYSYKHKDAVFVNNMVLSLVEKNCIKSLRNNIYVKIYKNHEDKKTINSKRELQEILKIEFNYPISPEEIDYLYERFVEKFN